MAFDEGEEFLYHEAATLLDGLVDGGEAGGVVGGEGDVVTADDGYIGGDGAPVLAEDFDDTDGHEVATGEHPVNVGGVAEDGLDGLTGGFGREVGEMEEGGVGGEAGSGERL